MLLTNLESGDKRLCVTATKVYIMRWRIEEYYRRQSRVEIGNIEKQALVGAVIGLLR